MSNPTFDRVQALIREHGPEEAERILREPPTIRHCKPGRAADPFDWNVYTAQPIEAANVLPGGYAGSNRQARRSVAV